jgi:hypothetical protein
MRWQQGLAESLFANWRLMFQRRGGAVGWIAFPFMLIFECLGPLIEVLGYASVAVLGIAGLLSPDAFLAFLFASVGLGILLSTNALFLEELSFHLFPRPGQQLRLFLAAILENFGYRQLHSFWRLEGMLRWVLRIRREHRWGRMHRHGTWHHDADAAPAQAVPEPVPVPAARRADDGPAATPAPAPAVAD